MTRRVTRLDIAGRFWIVLGLGSKFDGTRTDIVLFIDLSQNSFLTPLIRGPVIVSDVF